GNSYVAGPGSRFEELEHWPRSKWPNYAAVYFWCAWDGIVEKTISEHQDMRLQEFEDPGLGTGERPLQEHAGILEDTPALPDLTSEEQHGWKEADGGSRDRNHIGRERYKGHTETIADGGRWVVGSVGFRLRGRTGARALLAARVASEESLVARVRVDDGPARD